MKRDSHESTTNDLPGKHVSLWIDTAAKTDYSQLSKLSKVDVAVVGGGIVGIIAARLLKESGASVAVLEAHRIATGVTGHTTAKLTSLHGLIYDDLIRRSGERLAKMYADANQAAIHFVASRVSHENISCDFRFATAYTYTETEDQVAAIQREVESAKKLGLPARYVEQVPLPFPTKGAIAFDNQAQFHPRKFLLKLVEGILGDGSFISGMTRVTHVEEGSPCRVTTDKGPITADSVIIAANIPFPYEGLYFAKMEPKRSYVLAAKSKTQIDGMFYQVEQPNHTVRPHHFDGGQTFLIIGGEEHKPGHEPDTISRYRKIEEYAKDHFDIESIEYRWSTQDNSTLDLVPFIGPLSSRSSSVYVATGLKGWGMSHGVVAGMLLNHMVCGHQHVWQPVLDTRRPLPARAVDNLIGMNLSIAKDLFAGHLGKLRTNSVDRLKEGEAGIVKMGKEKVAAYRRNDETAAVSPNCTHMGCVVTWNNGEEAWDCPCHGSRFDQDGVLQHGPATGDLEKKQTHDPE